MNSLKNFKYGKHLFIIVGVFLTIWIGYVQYQQYQQQKVQALLLETMKAELDRGRSAGCMPQLNSIPGAFEWGKVHALVRNTVVQVFVYSAHFNWSEPYKTPQQMGGSGSGFFIDESGLIMTNAHVVDQHRAVYIQIPHFGKRRFDVEVIGVCPDRDLALLKVIPEDLAIIVAELGAVPILKFGDSDTVRRADEVMTLGYPLGQQSLKSTVGVVSGRQHIDGHAMIQIDAPINPGNSGGPSLNKAGCVIGINSSGIVEGGAQNVGYIIPASEVLLFLKQLEDTPEQNGIKFLRKPFLGMISGNGSDAIAEFLHNPKQHGFYVVEVYPGSPFDKAGVKAGDMVYEIDGHAVDYFGEIQVYWSEDKVSLYDYVSRLMPGDVIHVVVYRNGERKELTTPFDFSAVTPIRMRYPGYEVIDYELIGGMVVMELTLNHIALFLQNNPQLVKYACLEHQMKPALIITHILPNSEASKARSLHPATIIKEINGKEVTTLEQFREYVAQSMHSSYLTIKAEGNVFAVLPFGRVLRDEPILSKAYFYHITPFVQELLKQMGMIK